jgi:transaldolase
MAIYLDSAKLEDAHKARELGWVYGVTTNPTLMAKGGAAPEEILKGLTGLGFHEVYYQLLARDLDGMYAEGCRAAQLVKNGLVLKIAPTEAGFGFVARHGKEFPCCITAIFDPAQALLAREAGARYIAVYVNRASKQLGDGLQLTAQLARVLAGSTTEILAASLKSTQEAVAALGAGAQHITAPLELLRNLVTHPLSVKTIEQFEAEGVGLTLRS